MARQSLNPMKDLTFHENTTNITPDRVGRKRKDAPMTHLKYLRKRSGYTLETLSEITSISISYLSRLESGSRRLNTDLIRRLSHAFRCEPAELLQEVSHDSHIVTPVEFNKRRRQEHASRESNNNIPLYRFSKQQDDEAFAIKTCSPSEWRLCPTELSSKSDVIAVKAETHFQPHFSSSSTLYLEASGNLSPESTVIILNNGNLMMKKVWSITPTSLQLCNVGDIELLKSGKSNDNTLIECDRNTLDTVYKVVGYTDFDLN